MVLWWWFVGSGCLDYVGYDEWELEDHLRMLALDKSSGWHVVGETLSIAAHKSYREIVAGSEWALYQLEVHSDVVGRCFKL
jgi:hypothetical protein